MRCCSDIPAINKNKALSLIISCIFPKLTSSWLGRTVTRDYHYNSSCLQLFTPTLQHFPRVVLIDRRSGKTSVRFKTNTKRRADEHTVLASSNTDSSMDPVKSWCNMPSRHSSSQQDALYTGMIIL